MTAHELNFRKLDGLLASMPPEKFDYSESNPSRPCGCVAWLIARQPDTKLLHTAKPDDVVGGIMFTARTIGEFLNIEHDDADYIFQNADRDFATGARGIAEARQRLREIAHKHGIELGQESQCPVGDAAQFLDQLKRELADAGTRVGA